MFLLLCDVSFRGCVQPKTLGLSQSLAEVSRARQVSEQSLSHLKTMLDNDRVGIVRVINRVICWSLSLIHI